MLKENKGKTYNNNLKKELTTHRRTIAQKSLK